MTKRKWFYGFIICYLLCLGAFALILIDHWSLNKTALTKEEKALLEKTGELVLVGDADFPPLSFIDTRQQYSGYQADMIKELEHFLGISIRYIQMEWPEAMKMVYDNLAAGFAGIRMTEEMEKSFSFTRPYWSTSYTIIALAQENISELLNQPSFKVAAPRGAAALGQFRKYYHRPGIEYIFVSSSEEAMAMLFAGQVDMWLDNYQTARYVSLKEDHTGSLHFETLPGSGGNYGLGFGEQYGYLVPIMNKALKSLQQNGTFALLDKKWLGNEEVPEQDNWFFILSIFVFIVLTLIAVIIISNTILTWLVTEKTEQHRLLLDNIPIQVWYLKDEETYGLVNEAHARFMGMASSALEGKKLRETHFSSDEVEMMVAYNRQVTTSGQPVYTEVQLHDSEGNLRILNIARTPKLTANGSVRYIVCSGEDITDRKLAEEALRESKNKIEKLHEIAIKMEQCRIEDDVYQLIIRAAEGILNFTICTVDVVEDGYFVVKATTSGTPIDGSRNVPVTSGIGGKTYMNQKTYLIRDIWADSEASPTKGEFRSAISAPIGDVGIFQAASIEVDAFSQEDVELTELLLSHAAEAAKRIRSEDKITYMSYHDSLTGLYNRAYFDEELVRLNTDFHMPLSMILGDTNGLKLVNDVFGHDKGDELIIRISDILKKACRRDDIIVRWGGDEFAILLPRTEEKTAREVCRRIRRGCLEADCHPIQPSISLGVTVKATVAQNIHECLKEAENRMYRNKLAESRHARNLIISSLERILWEKSFETEEHARRLQAMAMRIGKAINLTESQLDDLHLAAALHDIGNIAIPEAIIKKPGYLTEEEWEVIKRHAESGYRIAQCSPELGPIAEVILGHHEWWDGSGYPEGHKGEDIPLISRIISVVDAYDVMTQGRPYKKPMSKEAALEELKRNAGVQFDPELVELFVELISDSNVA